MHVLPSLLKSCRSPKTSIQSRTSRKFSTASKNQILPLSLYVHWPYCSQICPYCDFNKYIDPRKTLNGKVGYSEHENRMKDSLLKELRSFSEMISERNYSLKSIYFGGGTPSLASPDTFYSIIEETKKLKLLKDDPKSIEITLEANPPDCFDREKFKSFKEIGVNRISLGVQSFRDEDLKVLGRTHDGNEARRAIEICQETFPRVTFDLMFGRHQQTLQDWKNELGEALDFGTGHLSLYSLIIEPKTKYYKMLEKKDLILPDQNTREEMYFVAQRICEERGVKQYEVSNFAKPGQESRHNLHYWNYLDFMGIGPGAAGRLTLKTEDGYKKFELKQALLPNKWISQVESTGNGIMDKIELSHKDHINEFLLCGMRKSSGIDRDTFLERVGFSIEEFFDLKKVDRLIGDFVIIDEKGMRPTLKKGIPALDLVMERLIDSIRSYKR